MELCALKEIGRANRGSLSCSLEVANLLVTHAEVAQLVEHNLAKFGVAGSSPVFRSEVITAGSFKACR